MTEAAWTPAPFDHLLALGLGLLLPLLAALTRKELSAAALLTDSDAKIRLYWGNALSQIAVAVALLALWLWLGRPLAALGLTTEIQRPGVGLLLALGFLVAFAVDSLWQLRPERIEATRARWRRDVPFLPTDSRELRHSFAMVTGAATGEEILFRGYLIAWLLAVLGTGPSGLIAAVALPAIVFGVAHLYQGWLAVAKIVILSTVFAAIVLVTGSLVIPMVLHLIVDAVGFALGPLVLTDDEDGAVELTPAG